MEARGVIHSEHMPALLHAHRQTWPSPRGKSQGAAPARRAESCPDTPRPRRALFAAVHREACEPSTCGCVGSPPCPYGSLAASYLCQEPSAALGTLQLATSTGAAAGTQSEALHHRGGAGGASAVHASSTETLHDSARIPRPLRGLKLLLLSVPDFPIKARRGGAGG